MSLHGEVARPDWIGRTFIAEESGHLPLPAYTIAYRPGSRSITLTWLGSEDAPDVTVTLEGDDIRELRDELSAVMWYWE